MTLRNRLVVHKKTGGKRNGRGFSRKELKNANTSLKQALQIGLPVDLRRRTIHEENVKMIKQQLKALRTGKKRVPKSRMRTRKTTP